MPRMRGVVAGLIALVACGNDRVAPVAPTAQPTASSLPSAAPVASASASPAAPSRVSLACGDATPVTPSATPAGRADLAHFDLVRGADGKLFVLADAFRVATRVAYTGLAFVVDGANVVPVGDVGRGESVKLVPGRGGAVFSRGSNLVACAPGASVVLPPDPSAGAATRFGAFVDGGALYAIDVESKSHGSPCARLTAGAIDARRLVVSRLDLGAPQPRWQVVSTRAIPAPTGAGCRGNVAVAASASAGRALVVLESCVSVDAGDSIAIHDCSITAERFDGQAWTRFALGKKLDQLVIPVASREGDRVAVPDSDGSFRVHRLERGAFVAEGAAIDGSPVAIEGSRMAHVDARSKHPGPSGVGFRLFVDELAGGAWRAVSEPLESSQRSWGIDLVGAPVAAVAEEGSTAIGVYALDARRWKLLARLDATPP